MRVTANKLIVPILAGSVLCLAAAGSAVDGNPAGDAAETHTVVIRRRSGTTTRPRHLEFRSAQEPVQGLDFGRRANNQLLLTRDGQLRCVQLKQEDDVRELIKPFEPVSHRELETAIRKELGPKFKTLRTPHYVIGHNTTDAFAQEAADLVEDLHRAFTAYFGARGMGLERPKFPMVVLIFGDEPEFRRYMLATPGTPELKQIAGYYSVETNRVAFFNAGNDTAKYGNTQWHNMTTVIHEATHQIAFNSGCHRRSADTPLWFVEGLAMYFEAPEIHGKKMVWGEIGRLNTPRLNRFAAYRKKGRTADSLKSLVTSDLRFHADATAADAYAESWALVYFLANNRAPQFYKYIRTMIAKPALDQDSPEERLEEFQAAFGRDLRLIDQSFTRYIDELKKN